MSVRTVGLNALFLDPGVSGGSETYLLGLAPALIEAFPKLRVEVATTRRGARALAAQPWAAEVTLLRLPCDDDRPAARTAVEQLVLPRLARSRAWDVAHSLANRGPRRAGVASVVTVLDVIFFHHRTMGLVSTHSMRWAVRAAVAGADEVIAISESEAADIAHTLGIARERISAIPLGPGRAAREPEPLDAVRRRHALEGARVVLCVAAKRPHKNQGLLIEALPMLPPDMTLVLVGHDEGYGAELHERARSLGVGDRVRLLDHVGDARLEALWRLADCAAFPTLAEGFGLPVLEAMRRGVPVACSDIAVLREVAGATGRYFDPRDPAAAAAAITVVAREDGSAGRERAAAFSWERTARETFAVYERAL